jgi:TolB protein
MRRAWIFVTLLVTLLGTACAWRDEAPRELTFIDEASRFAPGIASTEYSDVRLTISPDGHTALWFSRNRPGGPGSYDIWMSRREGTAWSAAQPVSFNSAARDFDPAFSADGRHVYFSSDRAGGAGGDDLYRVPRTRAGFGAVEHLGSAVNSAGNEWAPMLSADGHTLLLSSDGLAGARKMDLFAARAVHGRFETPRRLPGDINTDEDEFDATFLDDTRSIVFTRARDLRTDTVRLFHAFAARGRYGRGEMLAAIVNTPGSDTYAPMLDWSKRHQLTFTTRRPAGAASVDVYVVRYGP